MMARPFLSRASLLAIAVSLLISARAEVPRYAEFHNGAPTENFPWRDDRGELINAHDGGILYDHGTYYWYGMALRPAGVGINGSDGAATTVGIVLYSSSDLYNWKYQGVILACSSDPANPLHGPMRFERPKIVFNAKTGKYVLWFHYVKFPGDHGEPVGYADAGVASADSIRGPFTFHGIQRPVEAAASVKDCTLFEDDDGSAYFIYDHKLPQERCLYIVKLADDYLHFSDTWAKIPAAVKREAPALLKRDGYYYLFTSGVTGWRPNSAKYFRSKSVMGPYQDMGDPCEGPKSELTYYAQSTYCLPVAGRSGEAILMLERHNTTDFTRCSYVWLPMEFSGEGTLKIRYRERWTLAELESVAR